MWRNTSEIYLKCITNKFGNFIYGKIYKADAWSHNKHMGYSTFKITDEDGDLYMITEREIGKWFIEVNDN